MDDSDADDDDAIVLDDSDSDDAQVIVLDDSDVDDADAIVVDDNDSDESDDSEEVLQEEEDGEAPIEEDDPSLPQYDTDNRHSYLYRNSGPVTYSNKLMIPLDGGHELKGILTSFHNFPLNVGDEVPYFKLSANDSRVIELVIEKDGYLISINCGEADSYAVTSWLRDRSQAKDDSLFPLIDAVAMEVISHADVEVDCTLRKVAVCRVIGRVQLKRIEKSLTALIFSDGVVVAPHMSLSYELASLSRAELALPPAKKGKSLHNLLSVNSRLVMQYATAASIDRLFSVMTWIPEEVLDKVKRKPQWNVAIFLLRALPLDRLLHHILIRINSIDAQISVLDSIDYSAVYGSCISCDRKLFKISDLVYLKPWVSSAVFVNPAEYVFDTIILRHTITPAFGDLDESFSWFSGYGWRHLKCRNRCRTHLGWRFESKTLRPSKFCALQRASFHLVSDEIKQIIDEYDCDEIHPDGFFRQQFIRQ